jgi:hypothetical protein|tara:strand:+ start:1291 stop:2628 length:1338 start_codon:yes stop_codon:yes gene_type:complete
MKRIAIVGSGVVGINCLLRLIDERDLDTQIVWVYDSKTPIFGIGESTTPDLPSQISLSTNLVNPHIKKYFDATIKFGNKFIGWGKKHNFIRWLDPHAVGIHFDTKYFSEFFIEHIPKMTPNLELRDEKITHMGFDVDGVHVNNQKYDFVIDCTGGKSLIDHDYYFDSAFVSTNTALALRLPQPADWGVTITYAHRNGWMFGIPLQSRRTFGYTYNSNVTTEEEAVKDFRSIIPEALGYPYKKFSWTPRLSKYILHHSGRYARNGNAVGFLDPLESLAGHYYDRISDRICEFALNCDYNNQDKINEMNDWYYDSVVDKWYKNMAWMYHFGSKYDSPFWRNMVADSRDLLNNKEINFYGILGENQNFTDDFFHIIGDNPKMVQDFVYHKIHDYLDGDLHNFAGNYRDFVEFAYGMGADYAHKFPLLVPHMDLREEWGELHFDTMSLK